MGAFLIIQTASIGDVILATPLIEGLHAGFPGDAIDMVVKKGNEQLFAGHPFLREVITWDKSRCKYRHLWQLIRRVRKNRYQHVINVQRFASSGILTVLSRAGRTTGFDKNPLSFLFSERIRHEIAGNRHSFHEVDRNLSLIMHLGITLNRRPVLYPSQDDRNAVAPYMEQDYICMAPASLWFTKQYPAARWIEFIKALPAQVTVCLIGSAQDRPLCESIISQTPQRKVHNLAGTLSLLQTAALMKEAGMSFVNDSAPQHLASAVNAPVTTIFCSTVPAFGFGPLSENAAVVETGQTLDCRPCGLHGYKQCPERHFACALTIKTEQLLERIKV